MLQCTSLNQGVEVGIKTPSSKSVTTASALFGNILSDEILRKDFIKALEAIQIPQAEVKELKKMDDWIGGSRYSFIYKGMYFLVYATMDSSIESIKYGLEAELYKKNYEPFSVSDYYFDDSLYSTLKITAEEKVQSTLNYPSTAKFSWTDWERSRDHDLYSLSNSVKAKNAFGVEEEIQFYLTYHIQNDKAKLVYFEMNGSTVVDKLDTVKIPKRKKLGSVESTDPSTANMIVLIDGEKGKYGKHVTINGEKYIHYYIPKGTYLVTNQSNICKVYVAKNKLFTNSDGYKESKIVKTVAFTANGQSDEITIKSDEHIILTVYARVTLEKQ
ncbi:hypothetical protein NQU17_11635 [Clostridiaceae bacterium HFYG-1003]|nr:hypothetical protein NQU17_11635 [Clostridiaceae bacterium HFYG-1003]